MSMSTTFTLHGSYTLICCGVQGCGMQFAVESGLQEKWQQTGQGFYCPNGHSISYTNSLNAALKREVTQKQAYIDRVETDLRLARERRDRAEKTAAIVKGQSRALKKRVACGVCPCCKRSFQNLHRHMAGQHPGYGQPEAATK